MPLPEEKKQEIENERDKEVNEKRKNDEIQNRKRKAERLEDYYKDELETLRKKRAIDPDDPHQRRYWDIVDEKANELIREKFSGYNDWAVAMMGLMHAFACLNKAIFYDFKVKELTNFIPYRDDMATLLGQAKNELKQKPPFSKFKDLKDTIDKKLLNDDDLPKICFTTKVEDGKVITQVTREGVDVSDDFRSNFDAGIQAWLRLNGYDLERKTRVFSKNNKALTQEEFVNLSKDPQTSIESFLNKRFNFMRENGVQYESLPTNSPTISP